MGKQLAAVSEWRGREPALIHPEVPVDLAEGDPEGNWLPYWPSYLEIPPSARGTYLRWLAGGRRDPNIPIGYVFLYFYGIERRVLVDARISSAARVEIEALLVEVERLLELYGTDDSFRRYASAFLSFVRCSETSVQIEDLKPILELSGWGWEMPLAVRLAVGKLVAEDRPIPTLWALSWLVTSGQARLRTPARRCWEEFREMFQVLYSRRFPEGGMKVRPNNTPLEVGYRPASPSFGQALRRSLPEARDVTRLTSPLRKLQEIADEVMNGLDAYSRWIGRTEDRTSPAAWALLPREIAWHHESPEARELVSWMAGKLGCAGQAFIPTAELVVHWPTKKEGKLTKREAAQLTTFFARFGYGLEPDVRWGGANLARSDEAVVFRLPGIGVEEEAPHAEPEYAAATVLLHLAVALSAADGEVSESEERHLLEHLERALELSPARKARLEAHLTWLLRDPPGLAGIKKRVEPFTSDQKQDLARFLLTVAGADGHISVEELKLLRKVYPLLGLEPDEVYSDVHALSTGESLETDQPVTVRPGEPRSGFAIPRPEPKGTVPSQGVDLDMDKVQAKREESRRSQEILVGVFADQEEDSGRESVQTAEIPSGHPGEIQEDTHEETQKEMVAGLDVAHARLLRRLSEAPRWDRIEIERLCAELDLLPDGALEEINEAAFEVCGDPLLEGADSVELDQEVLKELLP